MIIIVAGPSGVGKTTLAEKIAKKFQLAVIHKDDIKEALYDVLGCDSLEKSKKLGVASWKILYRLAEKQIANNVNFILESNFKPEIDEKIFAEFINKFNVKILQIICTADIETIVKRFKNRIIANRHPGHHDYLLTKNELMAGIKKEILPMDIDSQIIKVDMNDFKKINYTNIFNKINKFLCQK